MARIFDRLSSWHLQDPNALKKWGQEIVERIEAEIARVDGGTSTEFPATFNNSGLGSASGTTFDGSVARTISYNTLGAASSGHNHDSDYADIAHDHDLNDLGDVNTAGVADGDVLTYNSGSGTWVADAPAGGSGLADGDYGDVTVSGTGTVIDINADTVGPTELIDTAVAPGSYTKASITVDAQGRLTSASNGAFRGALVKKSADQTAANYTTIAAVAWDAEDYDTDSIHDTVTNNSRLTVPSGVTRVQIKASIFMDLVTSGVWAFLSIRKNGSADYVGAGQAINEVPNTSPIVSAQTATITVSAGDYFEAFLQVQTDTSISVLSNRSWFAMEIVE